MTTPGSGFGLGSPPGGYGGSPPGGYGSSSGPSILGGGPVPAGGGYRPPRKSGSGGLIALVVVAVVLLGSIVALMVFLITRKGGPIAADPSSLPAKQASVAHKHVPPGCDVVARANVAQMLDVPAVKAHLVPVLDEMQVSAVTDPDARALDALLRASGIDAKRDLKDVAVCMKGAGLPESQQKLLLVIGGDLRPETVVPALEQSERRSADKPVVTKSDGRLVLRMRSSDGDAIIAGQAADAAIVLTNDESLFAGAVKESPSYQSEYALPTATEVAIVAGPAVMRDAMSGGGPNPFLQDLNAITRVVGTASLAEARLELRLGTTSAQAAKGLLDVYNLVLGPMLKQQIGGAKEKTPGANVLSSAQPRIDGNDFVLSAQGTSADVDAAARELARILREERKKGSFGL
jgi:hypothetical protein